MARTTLLLLGSALLALLALAASASAHDRVCVRADGTWVDNEHENCDSSYEIQFLIGWQVEPPLTGQRNGLFLGVEDPANNRAPITNDTTLNARYEFGGKTYPLSLRPQFGAPGRYTDEIIPTRPGTYTLHVNGTVMGIPINFTKEPETVDPASDFEFPEPASAAVGQQLSALESRNQALQQENQDLKNRVTSLESKVASLETKRSPGPEPVLALGLLALAAVALRRRR